MPKAVPEGRGVGLHRSYPEIRQPGAYRSQRGTRATQGRRSRWPLPGRRTHSQAPSAKRIFGRPGSEWRVVQFGWPRPAHPENRPGRVWWNRVRRWRSNRSVRPGYPARRLASVAFFPYSSTRGRASGSPGTDLQGVYHHALRTVSQVDVTEPGHTTPGPTPKARLSGSPAEEKARKTGSRDSRGEMIPPLESGCRARLLFPGF